MTSLGSVSVHIYPFEMLREQYNLDGVRFFKKRLRSLVSALGFVTPVAFERHHIATNPVKWAAHYQ